MSNSPCQIKLLLQAVGCESICGLVMHRNLHRSAHSPLSAPLNPIQGPPSRRRSRGAVCLNPHRPTQLPPPSGPSDLQCSSIGRLRSIPEGRSSYSLTPRGPARRGAYDTKAGPHRVNLNRPDQPLLDVGLSI